MAFHINLLIAFQIYFNLPLWKLGPFPLRILFLYLFEEACFCYESTCPRAIRSHYQTFKEKSKKTAQVKAGLDEMEGGNGGAQDGGNEGDVNGVPNSMTT